MRGQSTIGVPHPMPYQGSKRSLAPDIIAYFPRDADRLIEPFSGSAAVTLAAAYHRKVKEFLLSDTNQALINLWYEIIHRPQAIADAYKELWQAQQGQEHFMILFGPSSIGRNALIISFTCSPDV